MLSIYLFLFQNGQDFFAECPNLFACFAAGGGHALGDAKARIHHHPEVGAAAQLAGHHCQVVQAGYRISQAADIAAARVGSGHQYVADQRGGQFEILLDAGQGFVEGDQAAQFGDVIVCRADDDV